MITSDTIVERHLKTEEYTRITIADCHKSRIVTLNPMNNTL